MFLVILAIFLCNILHVECDLKVFPSKENNSNPIVETNVGTIRGRRSEDGTYFMFKGIPYAQVNESNIFGPAIPHPKFEDIFDANIESICPQREQFNRTIVGSLDCLHVNVYVPNKADTRNKLPVLVWIYGGNFEIGFAGTFLYGPSFIVKHDVILVMFNYRLGPYGFFCLDIPEVAGNQGLKDQVLALRWVKNNINAFGGDDNRITIGGHSVGAACVHLHLHYLKEKLFHRIIIQSIIPPLYDLFGESDLNLPIRLANNLNYSTNDTKDALAFLSQIETKTVIAASYKLGISYNPCIEKKNVNADNYITEHPINVRLPNLEGIDVLIGITDDEMQFNLCNNNPQVLQSAPAIFPWIFMVRNGFEYGGNTHVLNEMAKILKQFYLGDEELSIENCQSIVDTVSDFLINYQTMKIVQSYIENGVTNIYFYFFSYNGERNFGKKLINLTTGGAKHCDELGYLFDMSYMNKSMDPADELIVDRMTELWTNFMKYGNPTPAPTKLVPMIWPRVTLKKKYFLQLDSELRVIPNPFHDRMAFLELFYKSNWMYDKHLKHKITYIQQLSKNDNPAIPHPKFEDIFDANIESICPQREQFNHTIVGSLDCLHVNVYVPNKADTRDKLPVLVWIYGGEFEIGFAGTFLYGPSFIVRHDVILVTFNYRLGPYGFFCLDMPEVAGNQGLKDQVLALRWVKNNINAFRGDDNQVTIGGHSVGAACIHLHLHYLKEKLFHRIILQSIIPPLYDLFGESDLNLPIRLANNLNYSTTDTKDALAFLSQIETKTVIAASLKLGISYNPCIEKTFENADNYITEHPINVKLPNLKGIDVLTGITDDEMQSNMWNNNLQVLQSAPELLPWISAVQNQFEFGENTHVLNEMAEILKQFYLGDEDLSIENCQSIVDMASDFAINYQTMKIVQMYMENGVKNIYFYFFSYNGERNFGKRVINLTTGGAIHADELGYLFDMSYMNKPIDPADELIVDRMTELWTNFIKYGNPTPAPTMLIPMIWPRVTLTKKFFLQLDSELRVIPNPFHDRMAFLEVFYKSNWMYYKHLKHNITYIQQLSKNDNVTDGTNILHFNFALLCVVSVYFSLHYCTYNEYF